MSPKLKTFSVLLLSFYAATAPCYALNQEINAEFSQASVPYEHAIEQAALCDVDCMIDFAEAGAMFMEYYHRKDERKSGPSTAKSPFEVDLDGPPDLLLPPKPAIIGYA